ncbi:MAG: phosphoadenylyl-sulfate reductase [Paracoccaceae bacterium]
MTPIEALPELRLFPRLTPEARASLLSRLYEGLNAEDMLREALFGEMRGRIALVSSFGAESVALLHLVARIDRATPVIFLDTEMLFPETLEYQARIAGDLGFTDMRIIRPHAHALAGADPRGDLHRSDVDGCCVIRKVLPLRTALADFDGWITGRKRYQGGARAALPRFETDEEGRLKLNPLADWDAGTIRGYIRAHDLPAHPLVARGFPSIGCAPCTSPVKSGEDPRAGRWRGKDKTECGIHFVDGKMVRGPATLAMDGA